MREIVFDTETTGFDPVSGDRMIEIGCVELINKVPTGKHFHAYINPEGKEVSEGALRVHKLSNDFLSDKPCFCEIVNDLIEFIGHDTPLVAHNGTFDFKFLNSELTKIGRPTIPQTRLIDTLWIARRKLTDISRHSLDALCEYFKIDLSERNEKGHGALLDSYILSEVYLELTVDREQEFFESEKKGDLKQVKLKGKTYKEPRIFPIQEDDLKNHLDFISKLKDNIW